VLSVCATPIGNLDDVTLRVLRELAEADVVLCEDTRRTRGLLARHGIEARLLSYHRHNEAARTAELVPRLAGGQRVALVSDAGLPGVNDPGARLIAAALEAGVPVTVLPGASAVETALVASGLADERYQFLGYLPRGAKALGELWAELAAWPFPAVSFESPRRLPATLRSLAAVAPDRPEVPARDDPLLELIEALHGGAGIGEVQGQRLDDVDASRRDGLHDARQRGGRRRPGGKPKGIAAPPHERHAL